MSFKVKTGISNRHVHLTEEVYYKLFDEELVNIRDLKQTGEFVSDKTVTIAGPKGTIEDVRILGPLRKYNQVEISHTDAFKLGVNPPVRRSGVLDNSETVTIIKNEKRIEVKNCCILAQAHIHMNFEDLKTYNVQDDEVVDVIIDKERKGIIKAHIKATEKGVLEFHIDRDEASAFLLNNEDELEVIKWNGLLKISK